MNSSKSAQLMMTAHNYREQGKDVIIMTTALDDRVGKTGVVHSRIGLEEPAVAINRDTDLKQYVKEHRDNCNCVLIDEAQFLTHDQVLELTSVVDQLVKMYSGQQTDFTSFRNDVIGLLELAVDEVNDDMGWYILDTDNVHLQIKQWVLDDQIKLSEAD